jgi:hypothetical protein
MAARPGCDGDETVRALLDGLPGEGLVDDVVQRYAAPRMGGLVQLDPCPERRDDDRHPVAPADLEVVLEPRIGPVHDLIDGEGRGGPVRMGSVVRSELLGDAG